MEHRTNRATPSPRAIAAGLLLIGLVGPVLWDSTARAQTDNEAAATSISALVEALASPSLSEPGDKGLAIAGAAFEDLPHQYSVGGLDLDLTGGDIHPVQVAGRPIGFFFLGKGRFTYILDDPLAAPTLAINVRRATSFTADENTVAGRIEAALILDSRIAAGTPTTSDYSVPEAVAKAFDRHLERFGDDRRIVVTNRLSQALIDPNRGAVVAIQMKTNKGDLLYLWDGLRQDEEILATVERFSDQSPLRGSRYAAPLVTRPLAGDRLRRTGPDFVLRRVGLDLLNPVDNELELTVEQHFEINAPMRTLELSLWSEVFKQRKPYSYDLTAVRLADGSELDFSHLHGDLVVQLPREAAPGEDLELRFSLSGEILHRPSGNSYWWLPIGAWLPLPSRIDARSYTVDARVRVADPFIPFGMGRTVRRWQEEGLAGLEFELPDPVQFAVVLAGKYHSYSETRDDQTITLSSYAFAQDEPMRQIADNVFELIDYYQEMLGEFPYKELNILEINAFGFGIGPPGVIYLTQEGFDPGPAGRSFRKEINKRMAHEVGHMWWGHVAQMTSYDDQWLSESIAEYLAAVALEDLVGRDSLKKALREWRAEAADSKNLPSIYLANHLVGERAAFDRRNLLYSRGPLMFHDLRQELGDEAFFALVHRFANDTRFEHIDTLGFIELVSEVAAADYREWFDERLFGVDPTRSAD